MNPTMAGEFDAVFNRECRRTTAPPPAPDCAAGRHMPDVSDKNRKLLSKLHAMLGSNNAGERESAHAKILEILARHKLTWNDMPALLHAANTASDAPERDPLAETEEAPQQDINVLQLVEHVIWKHVELQSEHEYLAVTLWVLHAHLFERFQHTPRLTLLSPVMRCGKTALADLIKHLLPPCHRSDGPSVAAIYWMIDNDPGRPIVLDEVDNLTLWKKGFTAVVNSSHRHGGNIDRVIGSKLKKFNVLPDATRCNRRNYHSPDNDHRSQHRPYPATLKRRARTATL